MVGTLGLQQRGGKPETISRKSKGIPQFGANSKTPWQTFHMTSVGTAKYSKSARITQSIILDL
jgi:hypothetical protein